VSRETVLAGVSAGGIAASIGLRYLGGPRGAALADVPLLLVLAVGGVPQLAGLARRAFRGQFGADHLAAVSIVASAVLGQYLAGAIVVLMLSGGQALEQFAVAQATSVLHALAARTPTIAHRRRGGRLEDVPVGDLAVGDDVAIHPHEICPIDGEVVRGHGTMDESYLTGEPFTIAKGPGSAVLSGAVNGEAALDVRAVRIAADSRYVRIMRVMQEAEQRRPRLRRIGDQLGAWYTPLALGIGAFAWATSGDPLRFLSVIVVATPCPLLIAIPVAIIGGISSAARHGIIVRDPAALEELTRCRTMILDKTGTLTYGRPALSEELYGASFARARVLPMVAALERHSRHPLAAAVVDAAALANYGEPPVTWIREEPGAGLRGKVGDAEILITSRAHAGGLELPAAPSAGLECIVIVDGRYAASYRFRDIPRSDSRGFVGHLGPMHRFARVMLVSGDRVSEVARLAEAVGIHEIAASVSPEEKLAIVRKETAEAPTVFVGDGINDAPALMAASVGIAFGQHSDVTSEAARIVIVDTSLTKVDEVIHLSRRLRRIALESAVGGMSLSAIGMGIAAVGWLSPVAGAVVQEIIDVIAVLNALRMTRPPARAADVLECAGSGHAGVPVAHLQPRETHEQTTSIVPLSRTAQDGSRHRHQQS
jgi:heavy metal translocating P-type ATPase